MASGQLMQMTEGRKKTQDTLKTDYKNVDKQFKEQLIKTKVSWSRPKIKAISSFAVGRRVCQ